MPRIQERNETKYPNSNPALAGRRVNSRVFRIAPPDLVHDEPAVSLAATSPVIVKTGPGGGDFRGKTNFV